MRYTPGLIKLMLERKISFKNKIKGKNIYDIIFYDTNEFFSYNEKIKKEEKVKVYTEWVDIYW